MFFTKGMNVRYNDIKVRTWINENDVALECRINENKFKASDFSKLTGIVVKEFVKTYGK